MPRSSSRAPVDRIENISIFTGYLRTHGVGCHTAPVRGNDVFDEGPNGRFNIAR